MKRIKEQDIYESIINIFPEKKIDLKASFSEMELSSMEIMEIICMIEEKYEINVKDEDLDKIRNIESLIMCIKSYYETV